MSLKRQSEDITTVSKKIKTTNILPVQAVVYCRISTKEQSLESQKDSCVQYCLEHNYQIIEVITESCSARKSKCQPKLLQLLKNKTNITIVVNSVDRFSRNVTKCITMCKIMKKNHINLISVTDQIDLSTAYGQHAFRTRVSTAQLESDIISERVRRTINYKRTNGLSLTSKPSYGYKIVDRKKVINYDEQSVIHFIHKFHRKTITSSHFTSELYKLLNIFNKPEDFYVRVVFEDERHDVEIESMYITSEIIADILNDYEILNRNKEWTKQSISKLCYTQSIEADINFMII